MDGSYTMGCVCVYEREREYVRMMKEALGYIIDEGDEGETPI